MLFKTSFSDAISINEDERIYRSEFLSEYSSVLGTRMGVPHFTKFDMGGVRRWRGVRHWVIALMCTVSRGEDAPDAKINFSERQEGSTASHKTCDHLSVTGLAPRFQNQS